MEIVDVFLDELQKKILVAKEPINDYEIKRNKRLELQNIFYKYEIMEELNLEKLLSFSNEDIKSVLKILDEEKVDNLYRVFLTNKMVVEMYDQVKSGFSNNFEAPQYFDALKWLKKVVERVNNFFNSFEERNQDFVDELKDKVNFYSKYLNFFRNRVLIEPILDLKEFNILLDELNLNIKDKALLKKEIGKFNVGLLLNNQSKLSVNFDKYYVICRKKRKKYKHIYLKLKNEDFSFADINNLAVKKEASLKCNCNDVKQVLCIILMERKLNDVRQSNYEDSLSVLNYLDEILAFSREEITDVSKSKDDITTLENTIIAEVRSLLEENKQELENVNENELNAFLAQNFESDDANVIKYKIFSILLMLKSELLKYDNTLDMKEAHEIAFANIKDYLSAYKLLKDKLK